MAYTSYRQNRLKALCATLAFIGVMAYLSYHAINGNRGLLALVQLNREMEERQQELEKLRADRMKMEHKVKLMRTDSLDLDLLDEQTRRLLGYAGKEETVFLFNEKDKKEAEKTKKK